MIDVFDKFSLQIPLLGFLYGSCEDEARHLLDSLASSYMSEITQSPPQLDIVQQPPIISYFSEDVFVGLLFLPADSKHLPEMVYL